METTGRKSIGFMGLGLGGVYPKGPVSLEEGPECPSESPWVSLGSQKPSILRFPNLLGPLG